MEYHERRENTEPDTEHEGYCLDIGIVEMCENFLREAAEADGYGQPDESLLQKLGDITLRQAAGGICRGLSIAVSPRKSLSFLSEASKMRKALTRKKALI